MFRNPRVRRAIQRQERLIHRGELPAIIVVYAGDGPDTARKGPKKNPLSSLVAAAAGGGGEEDPWTWDWFWMWVQRIGALGSVVTFITVVVGFIVFGFRI